MGGLSTLGTDLTAPGPIGGTTPSTGAFTAVTVGTIATLMTELQVASTVTTSPRGIMSSQYNTGTDGARLHMRKARGTEGSPTVIVSGDNLGRLVASGYDGANYLEMSSIILGTEGTIAATRVPTNIIFQTATNATPSVLTTRLTIDSAGLATFTGGTTALTVGVGGASGLTQGLSASGADTKLNYTGGFRLSFVNSSSGYIPLQVGTTAGGASVQITGATDIPTVSIGSYSVTGSGTSSMILGSGTLFTSGVVHADDRAYTVTAAGAGSTLFRIRGGAAGATDKFSIDAAAGGFTVVGNSTITSGALSFSTNQLIAWGSNSITAAVTPVVDGSSMTLTSVASSVTSGGSSGIRMVAGFTPPSGSASFGGLHINPTINGVSTGTAYGLGIASKTNVLTGGKIKLLSIGTSPTDLFNVSYAALMELWVSGGLNLGGTVDPGAGNFIAAGHIQSSTTAPAVSNTSANSCGTTAATIAGTDVAGKVTVGATAGTSCTVTFTTAWTNAPACAVTNETTANLLRATSTTSTVIIAGTMVAGDVLAYMCLGRV